MKFACRQTACLLLAAVLALTLLSCARTANPTDLWKTATYHDDTTLGNGENSVVVTITAGEISVTLTIKTDEDNLGDAMYENGLVDDPVYFSVCNGMTVDPNTDNAYWAFQIDGTLATVGIGDAPVPSANLYTIIYTTW